MTTQMQWLRTMEMCSLSVLEAKSLTPRWTRGGSPRGLCRRVGGMLFPASGSGWQSTLSLGVQLPLPPSPGPLSSLVSGSSHDLPRSTLSVGIAPTLVRDDLVFITSTQTRSHSKVLGGHEGLGSRLFKSSSRPSEGGHWGRKAVKRDG